MIHGRVASAVIASALAAACAAPPATPHAEYLSPSRTSEADERQPVKFATLLRLVHEDAVRDIPTLLDHLPASFRSRPVLMFHSRSVQTGTVSAPRAILFGNDARFVLSFNGDPTEGGYDSVETLAFDDAAGFTLREIRFPSGDVGAPVISTENPPECLKCHGSPPRPIWDTYPVWPGAYGERERERGAMPEPEREAFTSFLETRKRSPRYSKLVGVEDRIAPRESAEALAYVGAGTFSINATFGMLLQRLQYRRIAARVIAAPAFPQFQMALAASLSPACTARDVESFLPLSDEAEWRRVRRDFERSTAEENAIQRLTKRARVVFGSLGGRHGDVEALESFRFLVEYGLGISTDDWTMALERGTFDFSSARPLTGELESAIRGAAGRTPGPGGALSLPVSFAGGCAHYAAKSRAFWGRATAHVTARPPRSHTSEALLAVCADCHDSAAVIGPRIPFGDTAALTPLLRTGTYRHGTLTEEIAYRLGAASGAAHMPPTARADEVDANALEALLGSLSK